MGNDHCRELSIANAWFQNGTVTNKMQKHATQKLSEAHTLKHVMDGFTINACKNIQTVSINLFCIIRPLKKRTGQLATGNCPQKP